MCEIPIQYTREFILKLKLDENETLIKNTSLISSLITTDFLDILKTIETFAIDNIPTNNSKSKNQNYNKKKKYRDNCRIPAVRPQTFLNKVGEKSDEIKKSVNGNLNKLSNQNYDKIWSYIKTIYLENKDDFDFIFFIESIFDKATMQPTYCPLYVKLCNDMIIELKSIELDEEFTKLIIDKCVEFKNMIEEINNKNDDIMDVSDYDDFCLKTKKKVYKKGFAQFIGELYKSNFLKETFIEEYVKALVDNTLNTLDKDDENVENNIICLEKLIETCFNYRELQQKSFFANIKLIKDHPKLSKKLKFKILDILHC
jgi:translation initiation factor 4G